MLIPQLEAVANDKSTVQWLRMKTSPQHIHNTRAKDLTYLQQKLYELQILLVHSLSYDSKRVDTLYISTPTC